MELEQEDRDDTWHVSSARCDQVIAHRRAWRPTYGCLHTVTLAALRCRPAFVVNCIYVELHISNFCLSFNLHVNTYQ
jgi:hypothetical protein